MKEKIGPHPRKMVQTKGQVIDDDLWPAITVPGATTYAGDSRVFVREGETALAEIS